MLRHLSGAGRTGPRRAGGHARRHRVEPGDGAAGLDERVDTGSDGWSGPEAGGRSRSRVGWMRHGGGGPGGAATGPAERVAVTVVRRRGPWSGGSTCGSRARRAGPGIGSRSRRQVAAAARGCRVSDRERCWSAGSPRSGTPQRGASKACAHPDGDECRMSMDTCWCLIGRAARPSGPVVGRTSVDHRAHHRLGVGTPCPIRHLVRARGCTRARPHTASEQPGHGAGHCELPAVCGPASKPWPRTPHDPRCPREVSPHHRDVLPPRRGGQAHEPVPTRLGHREHTEVSGHSAKRRLRAPGVRSRTPVGATAGRCRCGP